MGILDDIENSNWGQKIGNLLTGNPVDQIDPNQDTPSNVTGNAQADASAIGDAASGAVQSAEDSPAGQSLGDKLMSLINGNSATPANPSPTSPQAASPAPTNAGNFDITNPPPSVAAQMQQAGRDAMSPTDLNDPTIADIFGQGDSSGPSNTSPAAPQSPNFKPNGLQKLGSLFGGYGQSGGYNKLNQDIEDNNIKNYGAEQSNDPNSTESKFAQSIVSKYLPGIDPKQLQGMSSAAIQKVFPTVTPLIQQQAQQLQKGNEDLNGIVQQANTGIDAAKSSSRNALGIENTKIHVGQQLIGDIDAALSGKNGVVVDPSLFRALTTDFGSYLSGGGGRVGQGQIDELAQRTFGMDAAHAMEYIKSTPQDAKVGPFLQNMKAMIQNQQQGLSERMEADVAKPLTTRLQQLDTFAQTHPQLAQQANNYKQQLIQQSEIPPEKLQQDKDGIYHYIPGPSSAGSATSGNQSNNPNQKTKTINGKNYIFQNGKWYEQ